MDSNRGGEGDECVKDGSRESKDTATECGDGEDSEDSDWHPAGQLLDQARLLQRAKDAEGQGAKGECDRERDRQDGQEVGDFRHSAPTFRRRSMA